MSSEQGSVRNLKVAVVGCTHGQLDNIYAALEALEARQGVKVDLLLCCGDFQSVRNEQDLACLACPPKYREMHTFYEYYIGRKKAPILTLFVGGNHEASNYLLELFHGGWVAPNIFFLGWTNVVKFLGLRIMGISGIFKPNDYRKARPWSPPFSPDDMRSVYHTREVDVFRLLQVTGERPDIILSHDWPRGIYNHGNVQTLLRKKPFFTDEVRTNTLGNPAIEKLLHIQKPKYWFSAHLHVKFAALVRHAPPAPQQPDTPSQEAAAPAEADSKAPVSPRPDQPSDGVPPITTKFLALDKCVPHRSYLQILDFPDVQIPVLPSGEIDETKMRLEYDPVWLAVVKSTHDVLIQPPGPGNSNSIPTIETADPGTRYDFRPTQEELDWIHARFQGDFSIPLNFAQTAPSFDDGGDPNRGKYPDRSAPQPEGLYANRQHIDFCSRLEIEDHLARYVKYPLQDHENVSSPQATTVPAENPDEIDLALDDEEDFEEAEE